MKRILPMATQAAKVFENTMVHCCGKEWRETLVTAEIRATLTQTARGFRGHVTAPGKWIFPDGSQLDGGWLFADDTPQTRRTQVLLKAA